VGSDNGYSPGMLCGQNLASSLRLFKAYHQVPRSRAGDDTFVGRLNCAANVPAPPLLAQQPAHKLSAPSTSTALLLASKKP